MAAISSRLEVLDVHALIRNRNILSQIDLRLDTGVTALLGRNGAGKTTLLKILAGVARSSRGVIQSNGQDIHASKRSMQKHRAELGWVPQNASAPGNMTVREFLLYSAWLEKVPARDSSPATEKALRVCGALELCQRRIAKLSGGERQRVILAASLVGDPSLILLDEPTVGLDPAQREAYLDQVRLLGSEAAVLYSTHLVDDVVRIADRVVLLDCGRVAFSQERSEMPGKPGDLAEYLRQAVIRTGDRNV